MASYAIHMKAYERKAELGGGFRAVVTDARVSPVVRYESEVLERYEEARFWCQNKAHELMNGQVYRRSSINAKSAGKRYEAFLYAY